MNDCPFCLVNNTLRVPILFQDDLWYFAESDDGVLEHAGMAITKRHVATPFEINADEWARLHELLPKFKALIDIHEPDGYNIGWNVAPVGGQHVMHAHLHIVGRFADEPMAGQGIKYALKHPSNKRHS